MVGVVLEEFLDFGIKPLDGLVQLQDLSRQAPSHQASRRHNGRIVGQRPGLLDLLQLGVQLFAAPHPMALEKAANQGRLGPLQNLKTGPTVQEISGRFPFERPTHFRA